MVTGAVRCRKLVKRRLISPVSARWDTPRAAASLAEEEVKLKSACRVSPWTGLPATIEGAGRRGTDRETNRAKFAALSPAGEGSVAGPQV